MPVRSVPLDHEHGVPDLVESYNATCTDIGDVDALNASADNIVDAINETRAESVWTDVRITGANDGLTVQSQHRYFVDSDEAARSLVFPAGTASAQVCIVDYGKNSSTNNITLTPDGDETLLLQDSIEMDIDGYILYLKYNTDTDDWEQYI